MLLDDALHIPLRRKAKSLINRTHFATFAALPTASLAGLISIAACLATACPAQAQSLAVDLNTTSGQTILGNNLTFGWTFSTTSALTVTNLGVWDDAANGLVQATPVGLWNSGGTLLASATVPVGTSGTTSVATAAAGNAWRFVSITPVALPAFGNYVIGAFFGSGSADQQQYHNPTSTGSGIQFLGAETSNANGSLTMPSGATFTPSAGWLGPNFLFTGSAGAPEPSAAALLLLPLATFALGRRVRNPR